MKFVKFGLISRGKICCNMCRNRGNYVNVVKKLSNAAVLASALVGSASELCVFRSAAPYLLFGDFAGKKRRKMATFTSSAL